MQFARMICRKENRAFISAVLVKGMNDSCPSCVSAMVNGERAVGSGVVKVFARAEELNKADSSSYPPAQEAHACGITPPS